MHILLRYGEIALKSGQVRAGFEDRLRDNLVRALDAAGIDGDILERDGRIFADVPEDDAADAALVLSRVPGVVSVSPVAEAGGRSMDAIITTALSVIAGVEVDSFAVEARRAGDHEYSSEDIAEQVGAAIVEETGWDVDLDDPDITVSVEARYTDAFVYTETVEGVGGLPIDTRDAVAVLMSDRRATVAAYRMMKRGCTVHPVYTGREPGRLETDMATLRQFDPDVKLTVMKGADDVAALERAVDLYGCGAAVLPHTVEELVEFDAAAIDAEVLLPNCGMSEEAVLGTYRDIMAEPGA